MTSQEAEKKDFSDRLSNPDTVYSHFNLDCVQSDLSVATVHTVSIKRWSFSNYLKNIYF